MIFNSWIFFIFLILARFFVYACYCSVYPLALKVYETKIRSFGLGSVLFFGKISGIIFPFTFLYLFDINFFIPFALILILSLVPILLAFKLKEESLLK